MKVPRKVAFLLGNPPGASETFIWSQVAATRSRNIPVEIYAFPVPEKQRLALERKHSVTYHELPPIPPGIFRRVKASLALLLDTIAHPNSWGALKSANPLKYGVSAALLGALHYVRPFFESPPADIIHCQFGMQGRFGAILKDLGHPGKLVTTFHGLDLNVIPKRKNTGYYKLLFQKGDVFTVNSDFSHHRLVSLGCPPKKIEKMPMCIYVDKFPFRKRYFDGSRPLRLLTVARLVEAKGLEYGLRALAGLLARRPELEVHYRVVGAGPLGDELHRLAAELNVLENVSFMGALGHDRVMTMYDWADIFLLPSIKSARGDEETQGVVVQEAQACGLPVIVTNVGGITEGMLEGETGVVCQSRDHAAIEHAIQSLLDRKACWASMGQKGHDFVQEYYSTENLSERISQVYTAALQS